MNILKGVRILTQESKSEIDRFWGNFKIRVKSKRLEVPLTLYNLFLKNEADRFQEIRKKVNEIKIANLYNVVGYRDFIKIVKNESKPS